MICRNDAMSEKTKKQQSPDREGVVTRLANQYRSLTSLRQATTRQARSALLFASALLLAAPRLLAQQLPIAGGASDFNSVQYYGAPHQQDIERLFSGAEAQPLPGGLLLVKKVKIEKFDLSGKLQLVAEAPECVYDPVNVVATSPGEVHVRSGDGQLKIDGEGFLWRQNDSVFIISNRVETVIDRLPKQ